MLKKSSSTQRPRKKRRVRPVPAVTRSIAILRLLGESRQMGVTAIAERLGMVPSTCLHILRVLVDEGLVDVDEETKRYSLGIGILSLARSVFQDSSFASLVQSSLDDLARTWDVTTMGVEIADPEHIVVVALSRSRAPFRLQVDVGSRFPSLVSATGRLVAAFGGHSWKELEPRFKALRWARPMRFATWKKEAETARKTGFSVDRDHYIAGVTIVAVPLLDQQGRLRRELVAAALSHQFTERACADLAAAMIAVANSLSPLLNLSAVAR